MKFNFEKKAVEKTIGIRVSTEDYEYIEDIAKKHNQAIGTITRVLVETAIKEHKKA